MLSVFEMMWSALADTLQTLWLGLLALEPVTLALLGVLFLGLALLIFLLPLSGRLPRRKTPEVIISLGTIGPSPKGRYLLRMRVSNLSPYPVQLIEAALRTEGMTQPVTLEVSELLASNFMCEIEAELAPLSGESGVLNLYFYAGAPRRRAYRLRGEFVYEAWHERYKITPLGQFIKPVAMLASTKLSRLQRQQLRQAKEHPDETGRDPAARPKLEFPKKF